MSSPLVSITIASFNMARELSRALRSAFSQTFSNFEVLVVDDGSTDDTRNVLRSFSEKHLRVFHHSHQLGLTASRNKLLHEAKGEFISVLDADDLIFPNKVSLHYSMFKNNPNAGVVWGRAVVKEQDKLSVLPASDYKATWDLTVSYQAVHSSTTWRKKALLEVGGYDPTRTLVEDADMFLKVGDRWEQIYSPEVVAFKFINPENEFRVASRHQERQDLSKRLFKDTLYRRYNITYPE